jgi:hypothetical protein
MRHCLRLFETFVGIIVVLLQVPAAAYAADADLFDSGKLLATAGVTAIEGEGGGGVTPWALITGYETRDAIGANAHYTYVSLPDFEVQSGGVAVGLFDRVELSYARLWFQTGDTGARLGLGKDFTFHEDVFGAKVRVIGDAVYEQDNWLPQIAIGLEYKQTDQGNILTAIGAKRDHGVDFYAAATKLFLNESLLVDVTLMETKGNQLGILGFGGDKDDGYSTEVAASAAYLVTRHLAIGAEYRTMPSNLSFSEQNAWKDAFVAYFLTKNASLTLAYVDAGTIATIEDQHGFYLSLQTGF